MKRFSFCKMISLGFLSLLVTSSAQAVCQGRDIWAELSKKHPAAMARLEERARTMPHGNGKLFRVSKKDHDVSYILGTIHEYDPRYVPLSPGILKAAQETSQTALELKDIGSDNPMASVMENPTEMINLFFAPAGQRPLDFLTTEEKNTLSNTIGNAMPSSEALTIRPGILALMLTEILCKDPNQHVDKKGVDEALAKISKEAGKPIVGLETIHEQFKSLADIPFPAQQQMLKETLRTIGSYPDLFETIKLLYIRGEIGKILALMMEDDPSLGAQFGSYPDIFLESLIDKRNIRMRDRALPLLRKGKVLVAVGAAHLPGEAGLLRLIEKEGYKIEKVE